MHRRDAWQVNERRILLGVLHAFVAVAATVQHVVQDRSQVHFDEDSSVRASSCPSAPSFDTDSSSPTAHHPRPTFRQSFPTRRSSRQLLDQHRRHLLDRLRSPSSSDPPFRSRSPRRRLGSVRLLLPLPFQSSWTLTSLPTVPTSGLRCATMAPTRSLLPQGRSRALSSLRLFGKRRTFASRFTLLRCAFLTPSYSTCLILLRQQPITVSQFSPSPNQALLSGLRSSDPYYQVRYPPFSHLKAVLTLPIAQQFAYLELASLTLTDSGRRQAIFKDVKPGSSTAGAWNEISRECLVMIGTELQRAKGRGSLPSMSFPPFPSRKRC